MKHKLITLSLILLIYVNFTTAQTQFNKAWTMPGASIIIDAFYMNTLDVSQIKSDSKVVGLIHKATEGMQTIDPKFSERQAATYKNHGLFGAYHLGTNADPIAQADFFLKTVNDNNNTLLVLNLQRQGVDAMSPDQALVFIQHVYDLTGKYPVVYVNDMMFQKIIKSYDRNSLFAKCLLWYERLKDELPVATLKNSIWDNYFLWQFSSALNCTTDGKCKYNVPGTLHDIDVSVFSQDRNALPYVWNTNQLANGLKFNVTDMSKYFPGDTTVCANGNKIENIKYVEVTQTKDNSVVDRYLVYEINGRTLVSRRMFEFVAKKMGVVYDVEEVHGHNVFDKELSALVVHREGNVFKMEYKPNPTSDVQLSNDDIQKTYSIMLGQLSKSNVQSVTTYDIKFECE